MKKVININFQGQVIAIEETAYELLKQYIDSLKKYFSREEGGDEIVNDIESRIAELFGNRLKLGLNCITDEDVLSIISSIGRPEDFDTEYQEADYSYGEKTSDHPASAPEQPKTEKDSAVNEEQRKLYRNENDKIIAGVCSGLAHYFKTDPVWIRIIFVLLFSVLFWVYLVLWIVLKPKALDTNVAKRLYRNPNDRFLGGVCGGIAAYFKIETWIPRLLFAAPLFLNLMGMISIPFFPWNRFFPHVDFNWNINMSVVVIYAVLWVIIPRATTVKQKLEMMGEEEYIKSIRETVSDNVASVKSKSDDGDNYSKPYVATGVTDGPGKVSMDSMPPEPPRYHAPKAPVNAAAGSGNSGCLNALGIFFKIIFFAFVGIFVVAMTGMLIAFLVAGTKFVPLKSLFIDGGYEDTMLWLSVALLFAVPVIAVIVWIIRRLMKAKSRPAIGIVAIILWVVGIFSATMLGFKIAEKFSVESSTEKVRALSLFKGDKLYVDMAVYPSDYYSFSRNFGPGSDLDNFPYYTINEDSLLFSNIKLQIVQSQDSLYHVRTISSSSGRNLIVAKKNAEQFTYPLQQQDSLLLLPEFFSAPISQGFRVQGMIVEIAVPTGKKIEIDERLDDYNNFTSNSSVRRKLKRNRNGGALDWNYGEEYILENGNLNKTVVLTDSI
ncbi:MAG TPA: PspC domain-containing protein [Petrimonas sp.]|uniref:PspC domain-containing protein n=1 Tax=Petrimonas sp. TaxID=2023866 RepID=UPI0017726EB7|nr:PspC domain-containing protein [Petrimonas sp.]MEA4980297.1 PspC domain-containing protein [Petrimonas sp.]MEA5061777.1 PspC domain-containing protein [Petrimonas sp.]HHV84358.1 PspC domain-containing protein [Petrimonas sp.]